jgi:Tfp pilus assembly protein PilO
MGCCISESVLVSSHFNHSKVKWLKVKLIKEWHFKCLIIFAIMIKNYIVLIMNTDQTKMKLESRNIFWWKEDVVKVNYGNHFSKYKMQLLRRKLVPFRM